MMLHLDRYLYHRELVHLGGSGNHRVLVERVGLAMHQPGPDAEHQIELREQQRQKDEAAAADRLTKIEDKLDKLTEAVNQRRR